MGILDKAKEKGKTEKLLNYKNTKDMNSYIKIILANILGLFIIISYLLTSKNGFWFHIDAGVFYFFNNKIIPDSFFTSLVALTNLRIFDLVSFLAMGSLYFYLFKGEDNKGKRKMLGIGLSMLFMAVIIKQCSFLMPLDHVSPTNYFDEVNRVSAMVNFYTKDSSSNSFPGDHGMMLFIFAAFIGRYFKLRYFFIAILIALVFSAPRIMSGAHWFGDIYAGALGVCLIVLSWILLTNASDIMVAQLERLIPKRLFPVA